jgi:hypothetical protein
VPQRRFAWSTKVGPVTMLGGHTLEPVEGGRCRNVLTLELSGFGSGLFRRLVGHKVRQAIETENRGFRTGAEGAGPTPTEP